MLNKIILIAAFLLFVNTVSYACSCAPPTPVNDYYDLSDLIMIVRIESTAKYVSENKRGGAFAVVEKVYKGRAKPGNRIFIGNGITNCTIWIGPEEVGKRILLYEQMSKKGLRETFYYSVCGRDAPFDEATSDLLYLDNIDKVRHQSRISGTIKYRDGSPVKKYGTVLRPLAGIRVSITGNGKTHEAVTDRNGIWEIYGLPEGKYKIEPQIKEPWRVDSYFASSSWDLSQKYERPVKRPDMSTRGEDQQRDPNTVEAFLPAFKHVELSHTYGPRNSLTGTITDPTGKPLTNTWVYAISADEKPYGSLYLIHSGRTPGKFNFEDLTPGKYYIFVNEKNVVSVDEPFETIYYPGVSRREDAVAVKIGHNQDIADINFRIPKFFEKVTVSGVLLYADNKPVRSGSIEFKSSEKEKGFDRDSYNRSGDDGHFSVEVLKGSTGNLVPVDFLEDAIYTKCTGVKVFERRGDGYSLYEGKPVPVVADRDISGLILKLPFKSCKVKK